jgi:hypothetical protein
MAIRVECSACYRTFTIDPSDFGGTVHCLSCGESISIPVVSITARDTQPEPIRRPVRRPSSMGGVAVGLVIGCGSVVGLLLLVCLGMAVVLLLPGNVAEQPVAQVAPAGPGPAKQPAPPREPVEKPPLARPPAPPPPMNRPPAALQPAQPADPKSTELPRGQIPGEPRRPLGTDVQGRATPLLGNGPEEHQDDAPAGALLVGFEVGLGHAFGDDVISAVRPIYRKDDAESLGRSTGSDYRRSVTVKANPGYAVAGVTAVDGLWLTGFSVTFARVTGDWLDLAQSYRSDWIGGGGNRGGASFRGGGDRPIVGILTRSNTRDCTAFALVFKKGSELPPAEETTLKRTTVIFAVNEPLFQDLAPERARLVGLDIGLGKFFDKDVIIAVRPIYRKGDEESYGRAFGSDFRRLVTLQAKPGYAVTGVTATSGFGVNGLLLVYARIAGDGLNPGDSYQSEWVGCDREAQGRHRGGGATPVIGIVVACRDFKCAGLGLVLQDRPNP